MSGGGILLGDDTGCVAIMLRPIRFQRVRVWILSGRSSMYIYSWPNAYSISTCAKLRVAKDLPKSNHCIIRTVSTFGKMHRARTDNRKVPGFAPGQQIQYPIIYTVRFESLLGSCIPDRNCSRFTSFPPQSKSLISTPEQTTIVSNVYCLLVLSYNSTLYCALKTLPLHKITPWDSLFRGRNCIAVNKFSAFYGTQSSLPCLQQPATCL